MSPQFDSGRFLRSLSQGPGVYAMVDTQGAIIYVGKASNLRKRLASYFRKGSLPPKTRSMMAQMTRIDVTVTHTEAEALILENNLIKRHRPRYNVLLRDDKSYPYIHLTANHPFPRLVFYRGRRREKGRFFGPYPSAAAARETIQQLQKLFLLRQCTNTFFANRSRPCLQYQIGRCSAPCVGLIDERQYARDVEHAALFLEGKNREVMDALVARMERTAAALDFEKAAQYRDQIARLRQTQTHQYVTGEHGDLDVIAVTGANGLCCVAVMFIRKGRTLGTRTFFPRTAADTPPAEVLSAFLPQYYLEREVPRQILLDRPVAGVKLLESAFSERSGHLVRLRSRVRGERQRWLRMATANAEQALATRIAMDAGTRERLESLQDTLGLEQLPGRVECFDISHTSGESTVASCVVFDQTGAVKSDYRRFNIEGLAPGDDYGAMKQALSRRYTRLKRGEGRVPDLLVIDGGRGQLRRAVEVMEELQVEGVTLLAIAKGPSRKPGREQLFLVGRSAPIILPADSPALHLIQQIRDEAHRFAITGHRQRRGRLRTTSVLEEIPGLGPKRRQQLLKEFGGLRGVARAGVDDLISVRGISRELAERIYDALHGEGSSAP